MDFNSIKKKLEEFLTEEHLRIFEIDYHKSDQILSILLDEKLDINQIEDVSNKISEYLDKYESEFDDKYILDVSTVGVERPIRNEDELKKALNCYIYVQTKDIEFVGTLLEYTDGVIHLEVMDKNIKKNVSIDYKKCKKVRYAVKF